MADEGQPEVRSGEFKGTWKGLADDDDVQQLESEPEEEITAPKQRVASESTVLTSFPEEWKDDFESLCYLGYLTTEVTIPNHYWLLRTLYPGEKLEVAQTIKAYQDTIGYSLGYKCAIVAASMISCDGEAIVVAERSTGVLRQKFQYVINQWYEPIIEMLYEHVKLLEARQIAVMRELGVFSASDEALQSGRAEMEQKLAAANSPS